jgi:hypothetical protein
LWRRKARCFEEDAGKFGIGALASVQERALCRSIHTLRASLTISGVYQRQRIYAGSRRVSAPALPRAAVSLVRSGELIHCSMLLRYTRDPAVDYCSNQSVSLGRFFQFTSHDSNLIALR